MKRIYILFFAVLINLTLAAQTDFVQDYLLNYSLLNPAYTARFNYTTFDLTVHKSWLVPNSPMREKFWFSTKFNNMGIGVATLSEQAGVERTMGMQLDYFYSARLGNSTTHLAFGVSGYLMQDFWDLRNLSTVDPDPLLEGQPRMRYYPQFSAGVMLYSEDYEIGFSGQRLLPTSGYYAFNNETSILPPFFIFHASYNFEHPIERYRITPRIVAFGDSRIFGFEPSMTIFLYNVLKIGGAVQYRLVNGFPNQTMASLIFGLKIVDKYYITYRMDYNFTTRLPASIRFGNTLSLRMDIYRYRRDVPRFF